MDYDSCTSLPAMFFTNTADIGDRPFLWAKRQGTWAAITGAQARAGVPKSAPGKGGRLSAGVFGAGAQRAGAPGKRPATAQPARAALAGGLLQPLAVPVRPRGVSAHGSRGDLVIEGTGAVGKDDSGLSAELMRILEERSLKPQAMILITLRLRALCTPLVVVVRNR